jgi:RimJ/RimL family protein N-acetyltransferase
MTLTDWPSKHWPLKHWPLTGLRLSTPRLELRLPTLTELDELASLAAEGIHDPGVQPFVVAWTDVPRPERARSVIQFHLSQWGAWSPADWSLNLVASLGGEIVGTQGLTGRDFAVLREVGTGSWLGQRFQGQGLGTEMRAAALHLAFAGLGAESATSNAFTDNERSLGVSGKLGYQPDGIHRQVIRGRPVVLQRLRLDRAGWEDCRRVPVEIAGLAPGLPSFGLPPA